MKTIHYYNQNYEHRTIELTQVMRQWVEMNGGVSHILKEFNRMTETEKSTIQISVLSFFIKKYNCTLPEMESPFFQPEIYEPQIYYQEILKLEYEHNTRPTSKYNIAIYIIILLAMFGLLKMCS